MKVSTGDNLTIAKYFDTNADWIWNRVVFRTVLSKNNSVFLCSRCNNLTFWKDKLWCISEKESKNIDLGSLFRHRLSLKPVFFSAHKISQIAPAACMPASGGALTCLFPWPYSLIYRQVKTASNRCKQFKWKNREVKNFQPDRWKNARKRVYSA